MRKLCRAALCVVAFSATSTAAQADESWIGASIGVADTNLQQSQGRNSEGSPAFGIFGQGVYSSGFGFELGLTHMPDFDKSTPALNSKEEFSISIMEISAIYQRWLARRVALTLKLGAASWRARGKVVTGSLTTPTNESDTSATTGIGLAIRTGENGFIRIMAQRYFEMPDDADIDHLRVDYAHRF